MKIKNMVQNLTFKMLLSGGVTFFICAGLWAAFNVVYLRDFILRSIKSDIITLSDTVLLGLDCATLHDFEEDIKQIIAFSPHKNIEAIRLLDKRGRIAYSSNAEEVGTFVANSSESCRKCHDQNPPPAILSQEERSRVLQANDTIIIGTVTPIPNKVGCSGQTCHAHSETEQLLGILDMEVTTEVKGTVLREFQQANMQISLLVFLATFLVLFLNYHILIFKPIRRLIQATKDISAGGNYSDISVRQADEIGVLAGSYNDMCRKVAEKEALLVAQREEYRNLFQNVPCLLSVVDKNYMVVRHNKKYGDHFGSFKGRHCYEINKGLTEKCPVCPVELTFLHGTPHVSEEVGLSRDGKTIYWIVYTAPIKDAEGNIVAAMEMMLDITARKELEFKLAASELRYHSIFESIPSGLFVLDYESLTIMNCNDAVQKKYGYKPEELLGKSFLVLFREEEHDLWEQKIRLAQEINQSSQIIKNGSIIYVAMHISHSEFEDQKVLIVSCTDVTKKLESEQQFIHSSKMTTLGEMATGVAHELNQPLAILKSISGYLTRKINKGEILDFPMLEEVAQSISTHVDRAGKIITHMRDFGRKSEPKTMPVQINDVLRRGLEFFSQQLKVRNIKVELNLEEDLPIIMADPNRLEQVFINMLINARDAIEERWVQGHPPLGEKKITLLTCSNGENVKINICDTGTGIPPELSEKVFEPFFTTKDVGKGTGLGLSISYGIIQDYHGTITATSTQGEGACFTITFPIAGKFERNNSL
ncbi:histidine kinase [Desulfonatronum thiosulfatophilum]|uniref:histidine kinase n=1 Tax=Desulfonatronum thiosulfatophilum TaxID=617002 RepID=A0A1G6CXS1_9BACT|nr:PAS domain S-box protein [Desulfonatronum thiosulfatophilum]SDB37692.1 histidine kinase [Desulfonatronum thiosulfatophilum]